jgi:glutathionylspermidine synthase
MTTLQDKISTIINKVSVWEEYHEETINEAAAELHSLAIEIAKDAFDAASERLDKPVLVKKVGDVTHWSWMKYQNATDYINSIDT